MYKYVILLCFLISDNLLAQEPTKIAIIDTGLNLKDKRFQSVLCKTGHKDFTGEGIIDVIGHGTHVAGLIKDYAGDSNYCLVILKVFPLFSNYTHLFIDALYYLSDSDIKIVNISGGGPDFNIFEKLLITLNKDKTFVVAAGNDNMDITKIPFYPASYNLANIISVGSIAPNGAKSKFSNFGKIIKAWEYGENIISTVPGGMMSMSGTSMSTAIHTGKLIRSRYGK